MTIDQQTSSVRHQKDLYMWPHVYVGVTEEMNCFHEEIFGPLVTVVKAKSFDHALHLANASPFGLSSACYTNDRLEAYRFKRLELKRV